MRTGWGRPSRRDDVSRENTEAPTLNDEQRLDWLLLNSPGSANISNEISAITAGFGRLSCCSLSQPLPTISTGYKGVPETPCDIGAT
jgi:hypothetical protein